VHQGRFIAMAGKRIFKELHRIGFYFTTTEQKAQCHMVLINYHLCVILAG
jgi:hypothetical protein